MSQFRYLDNLPALQDLPPEGVITPGQYGDAGHVPILTINARGIIVGVELVPVVGGGGGGSGPTEFSDLDNQPIVDLDGVVIADFS